MHRSFAFRGEEEEGKRERNGKRRGAINRAEIEREMDAIKIQGSRHSSRAPRHFPSRSDHTKANISTFLTKKELFHLSSVISWIRNHQKRKKKKKIIESKFILPCKLDLILHAPIFARNRPLDIRERRIYSDTESYCTPQRILYFVSNKFSFSISPPPFVRQRNTL